MAGCELMTPKVVMVLFISIYWWLSWGATLTLGGGDDTNSDGSGDAIFPSITQITYSRAANFSFFNNDSSEFFLQQINSKDQLFGRSVGVDTNHSGSIVFGLFFVTAADQLSSTNPSFFLCLLAYDNRKNKPYNAQVIWTANPQSPVQLNAWLGFTHDGDLQLRHVNGSLAWHTNTANQDVTQWQISYQGNIALLDRASTVKWQSFDHPSSTLMVLQVLRLGQRLTSWSWRPNPTKANYTMVVEPEGLVLYAGFGSGNASAPLPYWSFSPPVDATLHDSPSSNQTLYAALCWDPSGFLSLDLRSNLSAITAPFHQISPTACTSDSHQVPILNPKVQRMNITYATFIKLQSDGGLHAYTISDTSFASESSWYPLFSLFQNNTCDLPMACGPYGYCDVVRDTCIAGCLFSPFAQLINQSHPQSGCQLTNEARAPFTCSASSSPGPLTMSAPIPGAAYFSNNFSKPDSVNISADVCKNLCLYNCSCNAAFYKGATNSCYLIREVVGSVQVNQSTLDDVGFLKYVEPRKRPLRWGVVVGSGVGAAVLLSCLGLWVCILKGWGWGQSAEDKELERELLESCMAGSKPIRFSWKELHTYTHGFSNALGTGGFGTVYRGCVKDGTEVAVKQLNDGSRQGKKEFYAEVSILSRIHHVNLVRLLGYCVEGTHRLLVYEYMVNGSLDAWLFAEDNLSAVFKSRSDASGGEDDDGDGDGGGTKKARVHTDNTSGASIEAKLQEGHLLPWHIRATIAMGTAKGLAYLHEECSEKVIHMDLKPQNILLDKNFCPKISDFGMSRLMNRDQSAVMTTMRGTPGYLAPEWLLDSSVTEKSDVYSFGVMLLEIASGKKVKELREWKHRMFMETAMEGVMGLLDRRLYMVGNGVDEEQARRMVEVALLCMNREPTCRPAMSEVVRMLEGEADIPRPVLDAEMPPLLGSSSRKFQHEVSSNSYSTNSSSQTTTTIIKRSNSYSCTNSSSQNATTIKSDSTYSTDSTSQNTTTIDAGTAPDPADTATTTANTAAAPPTTTTSDYEFTPSHLNPSFSSLLR